MILSDNFISGYIDNIAIMNKSTAHEYLMRLNSFRNFVLASYDGRLTVDEIVTRIRKGCYHKKLRGISAAVQ
jgi:hypothetical protein